VGRGGIGESGRSLKKVSRSRTYNLQKTLKPVKKAAPASCLKKEKKTTCGKVGRIVTGGGKVVGNSLPLGCNYVSRGRGKWA